MYNKKIYGVFLTMSLRSEDKSKESIKNKLGSFFVTFLKKHLTNPLIYAVSLTNGVS